MLRRVAPCMFYGMCMNRRIEVNHEQDWNAPSTHRRNSQRRISRPLGLASAALARALGVSTPTVNDIVLQRRGVSVDMALRLAACFETTPEFWLNLQLTYDLRKAEIERGEAIRAQVQRIAHCA